MQIGHKIIHYENIDSTQLEMWRRVQQDKIENGTVILADIQTKGKGTHGRKWFTKEKNNIAFSLYIKANCEIEKLDGFTIQIAKIIVNIFKKLYNIELQIKEPNDIVYNGKKIGGILTETKLIGNIVKHIVIGIGINTNQEKFDKEINDIATSIKNEFGIEIDSKKVILEFCKEFQEKSIKRIGV